jgi:hypothetical protein
VERGIRMVHLHMQTQTQTQMAEAGGRKDASRRAERVNQRLFRRRTLVGLVHLAWPLCQTGFAWYCVGVCCCCC